MEMHTPIWAPSSMDISRSHLTSFTNFVRKKYQRDFSDYRDLHRWSLENMTDFWQSIWAYCGVVGDISKKDCIENPEDIIRACFFPNARLNFAENLLRKQDETPAVVFQCEGVINRTFTHKDLYNQVSQLRQYFQSIGLKSGDRVAGLVPNTPETLVTMLAVTSLGATWASCSPDFGADAACDRFAQISPSILIASDQYIYRQKKHDCRDKIKSLQHAIPSIKATLVIPFIEATPLDLDDTVDVYYDVLTTYTPKEITFERFPFNHPLYIMFSSGTTGVPKCIIHGAGGTLLQHLKEHQFHADIKKNDYVFYFTTCGWMMWNWHISALASGATLVLYEGSPLHPNKQVLFDLIDQHNISFFGTSAKYIDALNKFKMVLKNSHALTALKTIASTGSPLSKESFDYVYGSIKENLCLASISGGTDIISCFVLSNPNAAVWRGEIQTAGLGMDVQVYNDNGQPIRGEKGELVCCKPFASKPLGFWNDPDKKRFKSAYFNRFDNIWTHGDFAEHTENDGYIIHGRSDTILNPGGVRIGTAEIYRQVEKVDAVLESLAIGQEWKGDVRIILFVTLRDNISLTSDLNAEIKSVIRENATARHVPAHIIHVSELPKTKSGKLVELAVRDIVHGRPVHNTNALENPECLKEFAKIARDALA